MKDPAFIRDVEASGLDIDPLGGTELQAIVQRVAAVPADVVDAARVYYDNGR
jgi:hypothetical protein